MCIGDWDENPVVSLSLFPFLVCGRKLLNVPLSGGVSDVFPDSLTVFDIHFVGIATHLI